METAAWSGGASIALYCSQDLVDLGVQDTQCFCIGSLAECWVLLWTPIVETDGFSVTI